MSLKGSIISRFYGKRRAKIYILPVDNMIVNDYLMYNCFKKGLVCIQIFLNLDYYIAWLHYLSGEDRPKSLDQKEETFMQKIHSNLCKFCQEI